MKNKYISLYLLGTLLICSCYTPATTASTPIIDVSETVSPLSEVISWRFKVENGKLYKRLYNFSTDEWIGEWIYVSDYE